MKLKKSLKGNKPMKTQTETKLKKSLKGNKPMKTQTETKSKKSLKGNKPMKTQTETKSKKSLKGNKPVEAKKETKSQKGKKSLKTKKFLQGRKLRKLNDISNCLEWKCEQWCDMYTPEMDSEYIKYGCIDDGDYCDCE